jgi:hypothetical protein
MVTTSRSATEWDALRRELKGQLHDAGPLLGQLYAVLTDYFRVVTEGKTYQRQPRLGFTLVVPGMPPRGITLRPDWSRRDRQLKLSRLRLEVLTDRMRPSGIEHRTVDVALILGAEQAELNSYCFEYGSDGLRVALTALGTFLEDPERAVTSSSDTCHCCGRALTDGASLARGIGPECWDNIQRLFLLMKERAAQDRKEAAAAEPAVGPLFERSSA